MSISVQENKASLTVDGKSWDDISTDSGGGKTIDQITLDDLSNYGFDVPDIDDDTHILIGYDDGDAWLYIEDMEPIDLGDFDLDNLDLDWEIGTLLPFDGSLLGVDDELNITEEPLPDHIEIVTLPFKLEYQDAELINIFGMRVVPKNADGSTWTNSKYFRGYIPLQELIIDPDTAEASQSQGDEYTDGNGINATLMDFSTRFTNRSGISISYADAEHQLFADDVRYLGISSSGVKAYFTKYNNNIYVSFIGNSKPSTNLQEISISGGYIVSWGTSYAVALLGLNVFGGPLGFSPVAKMPFVAESTVNPVGKSTTSLVPAEGTQEITVIWPRYGDGLELTATFEIEVTDDPGGGGR